MRQVLAAPSPAGNLFLRRLVIFGAPLALGTLEMWHPTSGPGTTLFSKLAPTVDQWLLVHFLQVPLFGLLALAVYLLTGRLSGWTAAVSRLAIGMFAVFSTVLDAIAGIASGILVRNARGLPADQQAVVELAVAWLWQDPIAGNVSLITLIGVLGWVVALLVAAIGFYRAGVPRYPLVLLVLAALSFGFAHVPPFGPAGLLFFLVAALRLEMPPERGQTTS
jgi:hypothetical protein